MKKLTIGILIASFLVILLFGIAGASHNNNSYDLRSAWPNISKFKSDYLEGNNWVSGSPERSVLWFEYDEGLKAGQGGVPLVQHNWGPEDTQGDCNSDHMHW